ncbi:hypothetical protein NE236_30305 [Actinoallomurus purpureus]|uniref:CU044_2847 family protein n=1 Tax=Actinoallomurus purpureus TaxID=478114 RepID=UPI0020922574|nr:CU044_2847 family protein [Actinoallomurus purpureus]MCO6009272.1 hypothetical protein [Actinoallomurus purpureus]
MYYEIDPPDGFQPARADMVIGKVKDAVRPAFEAAKVVVEKARECGPDEVEVTFGVKVSGTVDWLIAKSAGESNFQIKMTWSRGKDARPDEGTSP